MEVLAIAICKSLKMQCGTKENHYTCVASTCSSALGGILWLHRQNHSEPGNGNFCWNPDTKTHHRLSPISWPPLTTLLSAVQMLCLCSFTGAHCIRYPIKWASRRCSGKNRLPVQEMQVDMGSIDGWGRSWLIPWLILINPPSILA